MSRIPLPFLSGRAVPKKAVDENVRTFVSGTQKLVAAAQQGDERAWNKIFREHYQGVYRHLRYLAPDNGVAEELVQETFIRALTNISKFENRSSFSTWLHGIAINVARNHWRSDVAKKRAHARLAELQAHREQRSSPQQHDSFAEHERLEVLQVALNELPDHLRVAFVLRDLQGLHPNQAAGQLGISPSNFAVRATRAKKLVSQRLAELEQTRESTT